MSLAELQGDEPGERIRKLEKINRALMNRVERSLDMSGGAFSLFQAAILLEDKIKSRTQDLEQTLGTLSEAYAHLEDARDEAEMAKQNLTAAIEAVDEGFALFDSAENLIMCNAQFAQIMPESARALEPGNNFALLARVFARSEQLVLSEGMTPEQWETRRIDLFRQPHASFIQPFQSDRWLQISNRRMASGATVIFQTDITDTVRSERQRHERELDEQARLLRATIDHLPQGICMFSKSLQLRTWNRSLVNLLGLPVRMLADGVELSRMFQALRTAQFRFTATAASTFLNWLADPSNVQLEDTELIRSDGMILSVSTTAMPDAGIVVTFTDVTKERQAKFSLQEINENLEQRVHERTQELIKAKNAAEEANKGKTRFLAAASHDLLQPLNASRIFLSLLQETELTMKQGRFVENADRAFGSVEQLLESLLDISRFETRSIEIKISDFAIDDLIQTLVREFQPSCERKGLKLIYVPTSAWVRSDAGLLRRVVQNLLANAVRYTESGSVLIGVRCRDKKRSIEIWDTGPGIPADKQAVIFEEFRRLHEAKGSEQKAMGLGLAIVDRIAKLLEHKVSLRSVPGKGSCFALEVEAATHRASKPAVRNKTKKPRPTSVNGRQTIIVVENDLQILEGMVELLGSRNARAIPTVSAEEALEALETMHSLPDLIIADYHLDNGNGLEAVELIRKACGRELPAIMITANHSVELRDELKRRNIALLKKPLRPNLLFDLLQQSHNET